MRSENPPTGTSVSPPIKGPRRLPLPRAPSCSKANPPHHHGTISSPASPPAQHHPFFPPTPFLHSPSQQTLLYNSNPTHPRSCKRRTPTTDPQAPRLDLTPPHLALRRHLRDWHLPLHAHRQTASGPGVPAADTDGRRARLAQEIK